MEANTRRQSMIYPDQKIAELIAENAKLRKALSELVNAQALSGVRSLVAGWNGENLPEPHTSRHPPRLGATLPKTDCGAVYALDEAMTAARAAIAKARGGVEWKSR